MDSTDQATLSESLNEGSKGMLPNTELVYIVAGGMAVFAIAVVAGVAWFTSQKLKKFKRPYLKWDDIPSPLTPSPGEMESSRRSTLNRYYGNERQDVFSDINS
jgi:hypothetical protein